MKVTGSNPVPATNATCRIPARNTAGFGVLRQGNQRRQGPVQRHNSLQWASSPGHLPALRAECAARKALGFDVTILEEDALRSDYGMQKAGALFSTQGAQIDAYALTHRLLQTITAKGGAIYEETEATHIDWKREGVTVRTSTGHRIDAQRLVIACGYESQRYLPKPVEQLYATYVLLTEPVPTESFWSNRDLLWETARPYHYLRSTNDDRILVGGSDDRWDGRPGFPKLPEKTAELEDSLRSLMPDLHFQSSISWAGIFAGTHDSLPYIGGVPGQPHTAYALGFGGNGILFSMLAADAISEIFRGRTSEAARLFAFNRA
ncbi:MAG: FAD-binding oxidoreductase [Sphingobacteriales bacterium]|nr:MAG: FAD-binding oxidoreductase [Sphingobacteriales bacterium]